MSDGDGENLPSRPRTPSTAPDHTMVCSFGPGGSRLEVEGVSDTGEEIACL